MPYPLRINGLEKSYGGQHVLGPIDLDLEAGTITAIIGRSGSGKTTLLRCLGGLEQPTAGRIAALLGDQREPLRKAFPDLAHRRAFLRAMLIGPVADAAAAFASK